jgi:phosphatidate cytidylyltransferase
MARPRKDVKFNHNGRTSNGRARRLSTSMSEISETGSNPGSPTRSGVLNKMIKNEPPVCHAPRAPPPPAPSLTHTQQSPALPPQTEYEKKKANFITRTIWSLIMIAGFFWSMFMGHIYMIIAVTVVQIVSFKEVIAISNVPSRARSLRFTKSLNWYFLGTTMYFLYGESVIYYFKHILLVDRILLPLSTHHRFISFMLYMIGMIQSLISLAFVNI